MKIKLNHNQVENFHSVVAQCLFFVEEQDCIFVSKVR
jgi:hypothetical protein